MADIKLVQLPDRKPVKIAISILPELQQALSDYASFYEETYGRDEKPADLIPYMLSAYMDSDRGFAAFRKSADKR